MKITHAQLQKYFAKPLPNTKAIADAFTFHAFEIESVEDEMLDIKVLPNRAADCNNEVGIALELSAILDIPLVSEAKLSYPDAAIAVTLEDVNSILGADFSSAEVEDVFRRLRFKVEQEGGAYRIIAPLPRNDMAVIEDVAEEVGRILGYERVPETPLPTWSSPVDQAHYRGIEKVKDFLVEKGFTEISTQSFAKKGDIYLANPLDKTKPALRTNLSENMKEALERAKYFAPLVLAPNEKPKLFEIGTIFTKDGEKLAVETSEPVPELPAIHDDENYQPKQYHLGAYKTFSLYPFITRDIALWVPSGTDEKSISSFIQENSGELLVRIDQFDRFEKEGRVSLAFRLVFQSFDRTLTDDEVNIIMAKITSALTAKGYEVR
jgi:phenylalanyl-tRNA synthetase beta subunit